MCDTNTVQRRDDEERATLSLNAVQVLYSMDSPAYWDDSLDLTWVACSFMFSNEILLFDFLPTTWGCTADIAMAKAKSVRGSKGIAGLQILYNTNLMCLKKLKGHRGQLWRQGFGFGSQEKSKCVRVSCINRACLLLSHCTTINFLAKYLFVPTTALVCWKNRGTQGFDRQYWSFSWGQQVVMRRQDRKMAKCRLCSYFFPGVSTWRNQRKMSLFC